MRYVGFCCLTGMHWTLLDWRGYAAVEWFSRIRSSSTKLGPTQFNTNKANDCRWLCSSCRTFAYEL